MSRKKNAPSTPVSATPQPQVPLLYPRAGLFRRLGAWAIDSLLVLSALLIAALAGYALAWIGMALNLLHLGDEPDLAQYLSHSTLFAAFLAAVVCYFFVYFWCGTGQTPGLKRMHLKVQNKDGSLLQAGPALVRMLTSAFGLGNFLVLFDRNKLAFQDHWGQCEVIVLMDELK